MENTETRVELFDFKQDVDFLARSYFEVARDEYKQLVEYLATKVFPARVDFEKACGNTEFSVRRGLIDLDIILQYSLVEVAFKKDFISDEVLQSIEGISKFGSLMTELRASYDPLFDWTNFNMLKNNESGDVLKTLGKYIANICEDFANFFVFFGFTKEGIEYAEFTQQKINNIINIIDAQNKDFRDSKIRYSCLANAIFKQLI